MSNRLADVARKVGVSEATVSRVLNEKPGVSEPTREAVLTALDVLGYERPTKLRGERARLVGLVLPELQNPIFPAFAEVVGGRAGPAGLHAGALHPDGRRRLRGRLRRPAAPAAGVGRGLRGRALRPGRRAARPLPAARRAEPADGARQRRRSTASGSRACRATTTVAVEQAMGHLSSLGHTRIGLLLGPPDHVPVAAQAGSARRRSPKDLGIAFGPDDVAHALYSLEAAQAAAGRLLARGITGHRLRQRPDGARRDPGGSPGRHARARRRLGRRLRRLRPDELHRAAADDRPPADRRDGPDGHRAPRRPDRRARRSPHDEMLFEPELVVRGSTGPARRARA